MSVNNLFEQQSNVTLSTLSIGGQAALLAADQPYQKGSSLNFAADSTVYSNSQQQSNLPAFNEMPFTLFEMNQTRNMPQMPLNNSWNNFY